MSQTAPVPFAVGVQSEKLSPVDIRPQDTDSSALPPLRFHHPRELELDLRFDDPRKPRHRPPRDLARGGRADCVRTDEGSVKAEPRDGDECLLWVGDDRFALVDVHWHTPSEHTVGGVAFPMEQHMKYQRVAGDGAEDAGGAEAEDSGYTVIGVFVHPGQANDSLDRLLMSARRSEGHWPVDGVGLDALLPSCTESYRYVGSTTTCPYVPGVRWIVLTHPVQASAEALAHYRKVFPKGNALETQPLRDRRVVSDRHRWW
ncbi:carbonic anhydrase family protein [Streptomyces phaeolivaceus]|uniref:carbonic anhydrase n=1 Tax=Streptomyces phaeolivaceus TaxID=2653200 RepID=A0A5P8KFF9_9ACTN|nr:carbonic anhydrase family protein [Streptomyces phaeolivaceus]QFR02016.1 carbonic anhydrase family protein [Streptomyces phaeolivaceus]